MQTACLTWKPSVFRRQFVLHPTNRVHLPAHSTVQSNIPFIHSLNQSAPDLPMITKRSPAKPNLSPNPRTIPSFCCTSHLQGFTCISTGNLGYPDHSLTSLLVPVSYETVAIRPYKTFQFERQGKVPERGGIVALQANLRDTHAS